VSNPLLNIALGTGKVVVNADYIITALHEAINQVGTQKTSAASHQNLLVVVITSHWISYVLPMEW
jgi:hypothetical protein